MLPKRLFLIGSSIIGSVAAVGVVNVEKPKSEISKNFNPFETDSKTKKSLAPLPQTVAPAETLKVATPRVEKPHIAFPFGEPESIFSRLDADTFVVGFNRSLRIACYSCEHLSDSRVRQEVVDRQNASFHPPLTEPELFRPTNEDYWHSVFNYTPIFEFYFKNPLLVLFCFFFKKKGFDRGHLSPSGNYKWNQTELNKTFNLANITPQVGKGFNRDYWAR